jgi:hypothetical protein
VKFDKKLLVLMKNCEKYSFSEGKIFGRKIQMLAHSKIFKSAETYLLLYFLPLRVKIYRNLV